jgi:uncharacterized protein (DUF1778 family)
MNLSSFMLACSIDKARATLLDHETIAMSAEGQARLADLLRSQPVPTEAMRELRNMPRLEVRE